MADCRDTITQLYAYLDQMLDDELRRRLAAGEPPTAIAKEVARARGLVRQEVYAALERLKRGV